MMKTASALKSELIPGVDGELVIQDADVKGDAISKYSCQLGRERCVYTSKRWFGHDAAKGTLKAEVSFLRGQTRCSLIQFQRRAALQVDSSSDCN